MIKLFQLQLALFFRDIETRPDRFISEISDDIFNQMPIILPIPPDAPIEIPIVMLNSCDGRYSCNIAKSRIDFILNNTNSNKDILSDLNEFIRNIRSYSTIIFNNKKIIRFGLIANYFVENDNAVDSIESKYMKKSIGNLEELNIRYNKRFTYESNIFNNIVDIGKGTVDNGGIIKEGILIQKDINNVPNNNVLDIEEMFRVIKKEMDAFTEKGIGEII